MLLHLIFQKPDTITDFSHTCLLYSELPSSISTMVAAGNGIFWKNLEPIVNYCPIHCQLGTNIQILVLPQRQQKHVKKYIYISKIYILNYILSCGCKMSREKNRQT